MSRQPIMLLLVGVALFVQTISQGAVVVVALSSSSLSPIPSPSSCNTDASSSSSLTSSSQQQQQRQQENRVFVGGLTTACNQALLQEDLETRYGPVDNMFLVEETSNPYAFVEFVEQADAARAIAASSSSSSTITNAATTSTIEEAAVLLYRTIEASHPPKQKQSRSQQQTLDTEAQQQRDYEEKFSLAQTSTVIIQVQKSHVARLEQFLHGQQQDLSSRRRRRPSSRTSSGSDNDNDDTEATTTATKSTMVTTTGICRKTSSRAVGLVGFENVDATRLHQWFHSLPFPLRGVNKVYSVDPNQHLTGTTAQAIKQCVQIMQRTVTSKSTSRSIAEIPPPPLWKLNVFPPSLFPKLMAHVEEHHPELATRFSPQHFTHTVHLVHVPFDKSSANHGKEDRQLWSMGIEPQAVACATSTRQVVEASLVADSDKKAIISNKLHASLICRAQSKLQEAFFRYSAGPLPDCMATCTDSSSSALSGVLGDTEQGSSSGSLQGAGGIAVDCGAAPGGWTQFMVDHTSCDRIYSIDPGEIDPSVTQHSTVTHLRSKAEDAMSHIRTALETNQNKKDKSQQQQQQQYAKLWVSDMCLHQMSEQIDIFLDAQRWGVVGEGTFLVLTIKCRVGHADASFDGQVAVQRERLTESCRNLQTLHLFSNRGGERTIMGYLK